jgi:hypothetical protein
MPSQQSSVSQPPKQESGLLSGLSNLFTIQPKSEPESQEPSSTFSTFEPLSQESERILAAVPASIGGEADDPGGPADVPGQEADPIAALMAQVAFEPQDVQDMLGEMFDWLSERFQSDHWKLNERQTRLLGKPTALMLNSIWARLQNLLPDLIANWCEETPGAMDFIIMAGMIVGPKVAKQIVISRERAKAAPAQKPKDEMKPSVPAPRGVSPVPTVASWPSQEGA